MRSRILPAAAVLAVALASGFALAHTKNAPPIVQERQEAMEDMKDALKALAAMVKGEKAFDAAVAARGAETIHDVTARIPDLYPEGSYFGRGHALPAVWDDWDTFTGYAEDALAAARRLQAAVVEADHARAFAPALKRVADTCGTCHDDFKKDD